VQPHLVMLPEPTRVHIPNDISIGSAVFAQLTAERLTLQWAASSLSKLPLRTWDLDLRLTHLSLGPPESTTQTVSRSVRPFCRAHDTIRYRDTRTGPITLPGPLK